MNILNQVSQRDLRLHSREIMDAVERGEAFTVTRDGRHIGQLIPLRQKRRFVPREELAQLGRGLDVLDADQLLAEVDVVIDPAMADPFAR